MEATVTTRDYAIGSGNADLGYADPDEMQAKAELIRRLGETIERLGLTQTAAAALTCVDQPTLSKLLRGRFRSVTLDRLNGMLRALGRNGTVVIPVPAATTEPSNPG